MALSVEQAKQIVEVVAADPKSRYRVDSILRFIPNIIAEPGTFRNHFLERAGTFGLIKEVSEIGSVAGQLDCNAIADATANAIKVKGGNNASFPAQTAISWARDTTGITHTGTFVTMRDGTIYVFDWHTNLDIHNPILFESKVHFDKGTGVPFSVFKGFHNTEK